MTPPRFGPSSADPGEPDPDKTWRDNRYMNGNYNRGWDMSVELIAAILLWGGVGWLVDRWLGTAPWAMVIGFLVGNAAGVYLVYVRARAAEQRPAANSSQHRGPPPDRPAPRDMDNRQNSHDPTEGSERGTG